MGSSGSGHTKFGCPFEGGTIGLQSLLQGCLKSCLQCPSPCPCHPPHPFSIPHPYFLPIHSWLFLKSSLIFGLTGEVAFKNKKKNALSQNNHWKSLKSYRRYNPYSKHSTHKTIHKRCRMGAFKKQSGQLVTRTSCLPYTGRGVSAWHGDISWGGISAWHDGMTSKKKITCSDYNLCKLFSSI